MSCQAVSFKSKHFSKHILLLLILDAQEHSQKTTLELDFLVDVIAPEMIENLEKISTQIKSFNSLSCIKACFKI